MGIIYKITNTINGKVYIGQTTRSLSIRWCLHRSSRSFCRHLHNAIKKYGADNFTIEQIDQADTIDELNQKECAYIALYNSTDRFKGYNLMSGGGNSHHSEETKSRLRETTARMWQDPDKRAKIVKQMKLSQGAEDAREKRKETLLQLWNSEKYRKKTIKAMQTSDYRKKQSKTHILLHADSEFHKHWYEANKERHGIKIECMETEEIFASITDAAKTVKCSDTSIRKVLKGVRKTAGGYHWQYKE